MTGIMAIEESAILLLEKIENIKRLSALSRIRVSGSRNIARIFKTQERILMWKLSFHTASFREATPPVPPGFEESWDAAALGTETTFIAAIERLVKLAMVGGMKTAKQLTLPGISPISFSLENPRAVQYLRQYGANRVTQINEVTRRIIRNIMAEGIARGDSYQKIARAIRAQFQDFSYQRSKLIAITEAGNAYEEGNLIVARDLQAKGSKMEKSWHTANDSKVEEQCWANQEAGWIPLDDMFPGGVDRPLQHPRCRCAALYRRVAIAKAA